MAFLRTSWRGARGHPPEGGRVAFVSSRGVVHVHGISLAAGAPAASGGLGSVGGGNSDGSSGDGDGGGSNGLISGGGGGASLSGDLPPFFNSLPPFSGSPSCVRMGGFGGGGGGLGGDGGDIGGGGRALGSADPDNDKTRQGDNNGHRVSSWCYWAVLPGLAAAYEAAGVAASAAWATRPWR
ncbi:hypothetical protein B0T18DRAFT_392294 [Schizothecium vesticola]|uniref:Uncharacterized protein n=1 Tax=Schizothecium vesticola TaxID=314040 RepID=A0AA40EQA7_9PEZI|nr:hypothetical protein B0T18DRAFT_392294 [Schizothecium vesticola]